MHTPTAPVAAAYPWAAWPAPCSCRTRMCRIEESISGSYAGRIAPPGMPKMCRVPAASSDLIKLCAPVIAAPACSGHHRSSCLAASVLSLTSLLPCGEQKTPRPGGRGVTRGRAWAQPARRVRTRRSSNSLRMRPRSPPRFYAVKPLVGRPRYWYARPDRDLGADQPRPRPVVTHALLPWASASTQNRGAYSSVTSVPPASSAAAIRCSATSAGTRMSRWKRCRGSSCGSVCWNHSVGREPDEIAQLRVVSRVVGQSEHRRQNGLISLVVAVSRAISTTAATDGSASTSRSAAARADLPRQVDVTRGHADRRRGCTA